MFLLEMQSSQNAFDTRALIILHEFLIDADGGKIRLLICLHEVSPGIAEELRLNDDNAG